MSIYIDISDFLAIPTKTGIQRISGEICKYAPPGLLKPIRLHQDRFIELPVELVGEIGSYFGNASKTAVSDILKLGEPAGRGRVEITSKDTVLVPEIFGEERAAYMYAMPEEQFKRCRFIVFDLLPLTHPEFFPPPFRVSFSPYFRVARRATSCGFISEYTRDMYFQRLKRTTDMSGQVLSLGSDALGRRAERAVLNRPLSFTVLGTIEPRKNHALILEAFEPLLRQVAGLKLSFIGKMGWVPSEVANKIRGLASDAGSGFTFLPSPSDVEIRTHIEQSRATIYVSAAEGYGLPPVESLWLGTPVIASRNVPSLTRLGTSGIHYVDPLSVLNLRRAILDFLGDDYANKKVTEAVEMKLPTWQSFTEEVIGWCRA